MPLSRMSNSTYAMPNIIDSHDMGLRTVLQSRRPKINAYSTPIQVREVNFELNCPFLASSSTVASSIRSVLLPTLHTSSLRPILADYYPHHDLDTIMENPTEMELVNASLTILEIFHSFTDQLRKATTGQSGPEKFSIMLSNVSHTIECIAPITSDDDPDLAALYSRQAYLDERQQQALGELSSLPRCDTPGLSSSLYPM
ncbi:hypothetical protein TNCV_2871931 [Trichonephila clavipes]|nr:hypothetical protein TNCV_2871931 [Trichonephila clavipes]